MKLEDYDKYYQKGGTYNLPIEVFNELLDEIENWKEEVEELKLIVGLRQKRNLISKFDKEYDAEDKKKNPDRDYAGIMPDAEEVYKRYYKQKEIIDKAIEYIEKNIHFCENDSQGAYDICNIRIASDKKLLEILKGEENE